MKTCPQCSTKYEEDFLFCLSDGNTLVDESGEQETLVGNRVDFADMAHGHAAQAGEHCPACGHANRANSKFCKKCGLNFQSQSPGIFQVAAPRHDETQVFQSPVFTPPSAGIGVVGSAAGRNNAMYVLIAAVVAGALIIGGAVIYSSADGTNVPANNSNRSASSNSIANARNAAVTTSTPNSAYIGKRGVLTTNARIRSDSHKNAEILGVHYNGARIEVLDDKSYTTDDGEYATWFRVRVLENGCDAEGFRGCGNDLNEIPGQAAMEGWMSARNIRLD